MKRIRPTYLVAVIVALVLATVALAFGGEKATKKEEVRVKATGKKVVVVHNDEKPVVVALDDLEDGETREIAAGNETITITREGDRLVVSPGIEDAGEHRIALSATAGDEGRIVIKKCIDGGDARTFVIDEDEVSPHGVWVDEEGGEIELEVLDEALEGSGEGEDHEVLIIGDDEGKATKKHRIVIRRHDGDDEHHAMAFVHGGHSLMTVGEGDMVHYRCAADDTIVGGSREKLEALAVVACPVCGKPMEKLDATKHKMITMKVISEDECTKLEKNKEKEEEH